jgi:integrase
MARKATGDVDKLVKTQTPGVYKRGDRYVVVWRHRGKQLKSFHRTYAEAREAKGQRAGGVSRPSTKQPFGEYAKAWIDGYQGRTAKGLDEDTRTAYRRALELYAIPFFEGYKLAEIEPPDLRKFVTHLQSTGLSVGSVRKYVAPLKAMFATAYEDGDLTANPTYRLRIVGRRDAQDEPQERAKAMTRAELVAVLRALDQRWRLTFELLAHTGVRVSELLGLEWEDLEFGERPRLQVQRQFYRGKLKPHTKTDAGMRAIPLSPVMARMLWATRPAKASGPMFTTRTGARLQDRHLRNVLDAASKTAGVPWIGFHTFRHTCASLLLDSGKNIRQVASWLGHEDPAFTLRTYTHLMDDGLGEATFLDALNIPNEEVKADAGQQMGNTTPADNRRREAG